MRLTSVLDRACPGNALSGPLPESVASLKRLRFLDIRENAFAYDEEDSELARRCRLPDTACLGIPPKGCTARLRERTGVARLSAQARE